MMTHHFANGMYLRKVELQNSTGTILYIHGLGESGLCFEQFMIDPRLQAWSHVVPDLPGYGKSPWVEDPLSLEAHARHLAALGKMLGLHNVLLIGHSMGGVIGLLLCEQCSGLVRGFMNIEGNICVDDCTFSGRAASYSSEEFHLTGFEKIYDLVYRRGLSDPALRTYYASLRFCDPGAYHLNSRELVELSKTEEIASRLASLPTPCLYVLGSPRGTGEHSRNLLSKAGVLWRSVENAGHWAFIDQQSIVVDEVLDFASSLPSPY